MNVSSEHSAHVSCTRLVCLHSWTVYGLIFFSGAWAFVLFFHFFATLSCLPMRISRERNIYFIFTFYYYHHQCNFLSSLALLPLAWLLLLLLMMLSFFHSQCMRCKQHHRYVWTWGCEFFFPKWRWWWWWIIITIIISLITIHIGKQSGSFVRDFVSCF